MARTGLGRGLDVLLGQPAGPSRRTGEGLPTNEIPLELVRPNRSQPRRAFDPEGLSELAASIARHGVLQPIVVSADDDGYAPYVHGPSKEAETALSSFRLPEGVRASVWAAEPLLANPVSFAFDEKGRCFVAETDRAGSPRGVPDTRNHMYWLDDDLACRTVADRLAMYRKPYPGQKPYTGHERYADQLRLAEVQVQLNSKALAKLRLQIDSLVLRQGRLVWPIPETNRLSRRLIVDDIQTDLRLLANDQWELDNFTAVFAGAKFKLSGTVANASAVRVIVC